MSKDPKVFANHILDSINAIESFLKEESKEEIEKNRMKQSAVIRELEVIGEAVKNLPNSVKEASPEIAWKQIAGMRDKLIHHYFGVDLDAVWETIKRNIPSYKGNIQNILKNEVKSPE